MKLNLSFWQQPLRWSAVASWFTQWLARCGYSLFIRHWRGAVRSLLVVTGVLVALGVFNLLYLDLGEGEFTEASLEPLDVAALERLVTWKEERARSRAAEWIVSVQALEP